MSLGKYLKEVRRERGLSQLELSKLSGLCRSHIARLELDNYEHPSAETFLALSKALKIHPNELYDAAGYVWNNRFRRGPPKTPELALVALESVAPVTIPVLDKNDLRNSDVVGYGYLGLAPSNSTNIKGFLVQGFSLAPDIREGDVVFINTEKAPVPGNVILCYENEQIQLRHFSPASPSGAEGHSECHIYGVVVCVNHSLD